MGRKLQINKRDRRLFSNTLMMYIMTFSAQLFNLATMPYLSRTLGPTVYGKIGVAVSYMTYVQIVVDFGFILSATRKVAENKHDTNYLSRLVSTVFVLKCYLGLVAFAAGFTVVFAAGLKDDLIFYVLYLLSGFAYAMLPDFLYRGLEDMKIITYRTLGIKAASMVLVFVFVKGPKDYCLVPFFALLGAVVSIVSMYIHAFQKYGIRFVKVRTAGLACHFKDSAQFFASRVASTVYQASNAVILSVIYGANTPVTGYYHAADKLVSLAKTASSPVADSLYPYMVKNKNYKLIKKILLLVMPVIVVGVIVLWICAEEICVWIFGGEYAQAGMLLRLLLPFILVVFPDYILAFPVMVPLGLTKYANMCNVIGLGMHIVMLCGFLLFGRLNVYTLCISTSITEVSVFLFRIMCVLRKRAQIK